MKSLPFNIFAGADALVHLKQNGLKQDDVDWVIGASGGPKWFVLFGFDEFLFGDFFKGRERPLNTLGSSAGAWRLSCLARSDGAAAINRLAEGYSHISYPDDANIEQITDKSRNLIDHIHGEDGLDEIVNNSVVNTHTIAVRCKGWMASESKLKQGAALAYLALANVFSRNTVGQLCERVIIHSGEQSALEPDDTIPTHSIKMTQHNVRKSLLASGSIPLVIAPEYDIEGGPKGVYRDGGTIDYHLDLPFSGDGLVLYPHFYSFARPGWFDKGLSWRHANKDRYRNVVMLVPTEEFVASLPYGKIPDRKDFERLDTATRQKYFSDVYQQSRQLGQALADLIENGDIGNHAQPLPW